MIETSLIKLDKAIQNGQTLSAGSKVILPIGDEAEIYGFIVFEDFLLSESIHMPPLGECQVLSNRVICYMNNQFYRFPIFSSVSKASEEKYKLYMLYIPKFLDLSYNTKYYLESMAREKPHPKVSNIKSVSIEENIAYYYSNEYDLYFKSSSILRAIGTGFAVITRRLSKPTDNIKYEIFDSNSVMIERK